MADHSNAYQVRQRTGEWAGVGIPRRYRRRPPIRPAWGRALDLLHWQKLGLIILAFFLGRTVLLGELSPFVIAFAGVAVHLFGPWGWPAVFAGIAGQATVLIWSELAPVLLVLGAVGLGLRTIPADFRRPRVAVAVLVATATVVIKGSYLAFSGAVLYEYVAVFFESLLAGTLAYVFLIALSPRSRPLTVENFFCVLVLLAAAVAGTGNLGWGLFSLHGFLSKFTILVAAGLGGAGLGAAAGAVVGIIPGIAYTVMPAVAGVYAFAGFLGGAFRHFGKPGVAAGFLLGNILLAVYIGEHRELVGVLAEAGAAAALFAVIPAKWYQELRSLIPGGIAGTAVSEERIQELVRNRVRSWARMFAELARTFAQVSPAGLEPGTEKPLRELLNEVGNRICKDCNLHRSCWERDADRINEQFAATLAQVEASGRVGPEDFPEEIRRKCLRQKEMAVALTCLYETYRVNRYWYRRLVESREVVSEHLRGLSRIMNNLATELCSAVERAGQLEGLLRRKLRELDVPVHRIETRHREDSRLEIIISRPSCRSELACRYVVAPLVSRVVGQPFIVSDTSCTREENAADCTFRLQPALRYRVAVGLAQVGKAGSTISGDTASYLELESGKFFLLLSDGMGVGSQAALESSTTVSLLEHMFRAGFGKDMAVKIVNSILLLRAPDESFATVDLAVIDLYTAQAEFIKIGAAPGFVVGANTVSVIESTALPVGIIKEIDFTPVVCGLAAGDLVVMVTDGVLDCYRGPLEKETWLGELLRDLPRTDPQRLAELILQQARHAAGKSIPDDMTVLVGRMEEAGP